MAIMSPVSSIPCLWALFFAGASLSRRAFALRMEDNQLLSGQSSSSEEEKEKRRGRFLEKGPSVSNPEGKKQVKLEKSEEESEKQGDMEKQKPLSVQNPKQKLLATKKKAKTKSTTQDHSTDCVICLQSLRRSKYGIPEEKMVKNLRKPEQEARRSGGQEKSTGSEREEELKEELEGEMEEEYEIIKLVPADPHKREKVCGHEFHKQCFKRYVNSSHPRKHICPMCRTEFREDQMPPMVYDHRWEGLHAGLELEHAVHFRHRESWEAFDQLCLRFHETDPDLGQIRAWEQGFAFGRELLRRRIEADDWSEISARELANQVARVGRDPRRREQLEMQVDRVVLPPPQIPENRAENRNRRRVAAAVANFRNLFLLLLLFLLTGAMSGLAGPNSFGNVRLMLWLTATFLILAANWMRREQ